MFKINGSVGIMAHNACNCQWQLVVMKGTAVLGMAAEVVVILGSLSSG